MNKLGSLINNLALKLKIKLLLDIQNMVFFKNHKVEGLRMCMRFFYNIIVWYEVAVLCLAADLTDNSEDEWVMKLPVWVAALCLWLFGMMERCCFHGTRLEVMLFGPYFYIHLILFSIDVDSFYYKVIINAILNLGFLDTLRLYLKYGQSDMSNMKTHGKYNIGFQRMKSDHGNDCLVFYPVSKTIQSVSVPAYADVKKAVKGRIMTGTAPGPLTGLYYLRQVAGLCPLAELDPDF